jgi:ElaB/YqjD/DUF883 family membrane-anchored ribosome-binding protein
MTGTTFPNDVELSSSSPPPLKDKPLNTRPVNDIPTRDQYVFNNTKVKFLNSHPKAEPPLDPNSFDYTQITCTASAPAIIKTAGAAGTILLQTSSVKKPALLVPSSNGTTQHRQCHDLPPPPPHHNNPEDPQTIQAQIEEIQQKAQAQIEEIQQKAQAKIESIQRQAQARIEQVTKQAAQSANTQRNGASIDTNPKSVVRVKTTIGFGESAKTIYVRTESRAQSNGAHASKQPPPPPATASKPNGKERVNTHHNLAGPPTETCSSQKKETPTGLWIDEMVI